MQTFPKMFLSQASSLFSLAAVKMQASLHYIMACFNIVLTILTFLPTSLSLNTEFIIEVASDSSCDSSDDVYTYLLLLPYLDS